MSASCPRCGAGARPAQPYCRRCGLPLETPAGAPPPLPPGAAVGGRYVVERMLGRGGMGAVYRVRDLRLAGRPCALKEMTVGATDAAGWEAALRRWHAEAEVLASLAHPAVPQVHDRLVEGRRYLLVMEYVPGADLAGLLADHLAVAGRPLPEAAVAACGAQVASVLAHLHGRQPPVVHRDVKPANVLVQGGWRVRLVDFGLARPGGGAREARLGTPGYAAPEQYRGEAGPASDVYALGATLHHLLSGRDPSGQARSAFPPVTTLRPGLRPELVDLLRAMLDRVPARRPSAEAVAAALRAVARDPGDEDGVLETLLRFRIAQQDGPCPVCGGEQRPAGRSYCTGCGVRLAPPHERRRLAEEPRPLGVVLPADFWRARRPERLDLVGPGATLRPAAVVGCGGEGAERLAFLCLCGERRLLAASAPPEPDRAWGRPSAPTADLARAFGRIRAAGWGSGA